MNLKTLEEKTTDWFSVGIILIALQLFDHLLYDHFLFCFFLYLVICYLLTFVL